MTRIAPISAHLVASAYAAEVVGPAYDVLTPPERKRISEDNPLSFLRVTRSAADLPKGTDASAARRESAEVLRSWVSEGVFQPTEADAFYLYQLATEDHSQTGVVADLSVSDYEQGLIRRHEHTQEEKEAELVAFLEEVGVNSSPVCLTYRPLANVDAAVATTTRGTAPLLDFRTADGVQQTIWRVVDETGEELIAAFESVESLYLTDGHHRAAAAARAAAANPAARRFLAALFPADQLRILPYNRCVRVGRPDLLEVVGRSFELVPASAYDDARPQGRGEFAMYAEGRWWRLSYNGPLSEGPDVSGLDVSILHREILAPLLESPTPDFDPRVSYVPGVGGPTVLVERCRATQAVGFVLAPTSIEEVMAISDAGQVMPPKSTWFDPKARSGIFLVYR